MKFQFKLEKADLVPTPKKSEQDKEDKLILKNYRPISLLPNAEKYFKECV